jgi:hypothetical protein
MLCYQTRNNLINMASISATTSAETSVQIMHFFAVMGGAVLVFFIFIMLIVFRRDHERIYMAALRRLYAEDAGSSISDLERQELLSGDASEDWNSYGTLNSLQGYGSVGSMPFCEPGELTPVWVQAF